MRGFFILARLIPSIAIYRHIRVYLLVSRVLVYFYTDKREENPMKLSDTAVRKAKPEAKAFKMTDGGGMYLFVHSNGGKYWRFD
jgi:hypothetical protein